MPRTWRTRALLYFYGNANIAGTALALLGPVLLFSGVIQAGWLAITAGLYAAGMLLAGRPPTVQRAIEASLTREEILDAFDRIVRDARPHLTAEMATHLDGLRTSIAEVLPRLTAGDGGDLYTVRETVLRYLPETLANYLELPPVFRTTYPLKEGRTARQLLAEQLAILDGKLREIVANVAASDAQALLANGRFLETKFRQPDFLAA
jgi:hypothetical protein